MAATKWKRALELYDKLILTLREDRNQVFRLMLGQRSEQSKSTIRETESGATAMLEEDPLLLLRAIILTHLFDPRLGADQNLLRVRMAYEIVRMEPNDALKFYYQRFKVLKARYEDTMLNARIQRSYDCALRSANRHEIHERLAKITPKKLTGTAPPNQTNVFATKTAGGAKHLGSMMEKVKLMGTGAEGRVGVRRTAPVLEIVICAAILDITHTSVRPRQAKRLHQHPADNR